MHDERRKEFDKRPRKLRADPACRKKNRYTDELQARAAAMLSIAERNVPKLWIYRCQHCHGWHLTRNWNGKRFVVTAAEAAA